MRAVRIGTRLVGPGHPCFIIAEAGVNHNGSVDRALKLVDAAADAGADAVKFQTFKAEELVSISAPMAAYQRKNLKNNGSQLAMLRKLELDNAAFAILKKHCDKKGILFLSTPHTEGAAAFLAPLVPCFKLGSGDLTNHPFLSHIGAYGKPVILGTGMGTMQEVRNAVARLKASGCRAVIPLHCTTSYPCPEKDVNLNAMPAMVRGLGIPAGYSDHTLGLTVPLMAVTAGAVVLEKHFTLNRSLRGPDHKASLIPRELKALVNRIRSGEKMQPSRTILGSAIKRPTSAEQRIAKVARKSIVVTAPVAAGELIAADRLAVKRPGSGIPPTEWENVIGKTASMDLEPDHLLTTTDTRSRRIVYVSGTRADYGLMRTTLTAIANHPALELTVLATGMHLMPEFGRTVTLIEEDGFTVKPVNCTFEKDDPASMALFAGKATEGISRRLTRIKPDILLLLGDRAEMLAGATAATYLGIPVAHIHGGDVTSTVDETVRHAITKMAHIHFPATAGAAARIRRMGEDKERIHRYGAPGVDAVRGQLPSAEKLGKKYGIDFTKPSVLVVQHADSTETDAAVRHYRATLDAVTGQQYRTLVIYPNADAGGRGMIRALKPYARLPHVSTYKNVPYTDWLSLMKYASVLVGNSSSGIIEAPSFKLPVVNIGIRQEGRERANNVIDVPHDAKKIEAAIRKALSPRFKATLKTCRSPYGTGRTGERIAKHLAEVAITKKLIQKKLAY